MTPLQYAAPESLSRLSGAGFSCRDGRTRTADLPLPKRTRYHLRHTPSVATDRPDHRGPGRTAPPQSASGAVRAPFAVRRCGAPTRLRLAQVVRPAVTASAVQLDGTLVLADFRGMPSVRTLRFPAAAAYRPIAGRVSASLPRREAARTVTRRGRHRVDRVSQCRWPESNRRRSPIESRVAPSVRATAARSLRIAGIRQRNLGSAEHLALSRIRRARPGRRRPDRGSCLLPGPIPPFSGLCVRPGLRQDGESVRAGAVADGPGRPVEPVGIEPTTRCLQSTAAILGTCDPRCRAWRLPIPARRLYDAVSRRDAH